MKRQELWTEDIIDLISNKNFAQLTAAEREVVTVQLSAQEYEELHEAYVSGKQYFGSGKEQEPPAGVKQKLDKVFLQLHPKPVPLFARPVVLWKAAAVFLLLFGTSFICLKNKLAETKAVELLVHDTVFVEKNIELIRRLTDTVIEYREAVVTKERKRADSRSAIAANYANRQDSNMIRETGNSEDIGIRTLQAGDLSKELNNSGRSMKEDELVRLFSFTKI
jgi:hypothetical protein